MRRALFTLLAALFVAAAAHSATWDRCDGSGSGGRTNIGRTDKTCWNFLAADTTGESEIMFFSVTGLICFDPNTATEGADAAQITIRMCPNGKKPAANPHLECFALSTVPITGITGDAGVQDACERVAPGAYYIDIDVAAVDPDTPRVSFRGETK